MANHETASHTRTLNTLSTFTTDAAFRKLTHFVLADLVDGPCVGVPDDSRAAPRVEVEDLHGPAPAGGQHEVCTGLLRNTTQGCAPGERQPGSPLGKLGNAGRPVRTLRNALGTWHRPCPTRALPRARAGGRWGDPGGAGSKPGDRASTFRQAKCRMPRKRHVTGAVTGRPGGAGLGGQVCGKDGPRSHEGGRCHRQEAARVRGYDSPGHVAREGDEAHEGPLRTLRLPWPPEPPSCQGSAQKTHEGARWAGGVRTKTPGHRAGGKADSGLSMRDPRTKPALPPPRGNQRPGRQDQDPPNRTSVLKLQL